MTYCSKSAGDAADQRIQLRPGLDSVVERPDGGAEETVFFADRDDFAALDAFDQNLDIAIGLLQALHDIGDGADGKNFIRTRLIHAGIMLRGEKNFVVAGQRFFERAHARFAAHHERRHHVRKDDDVPNGHHRQSSGIGFFFGSEH